MREENDEKKKEALRVCMAREKKRNNYIVRKLTRGYEKLS